jgi:hypothetical protein
MLGITHKKRKKQVVFTLGKALGGGLLLDSGFCLVLPHKALIYPTRKDLVDKSLVYVESALKCLTRNFLV